MASLVGLPTPLVFLAALVISVPTAVSYAVISKELPSAGSAFTYVWESMSPTLGTWTGLMMTIYYTVAVTLQPTRQRTRLREDRRRPCPTHRVMSCLSESEVPEPSAHDAGAERTGGTGDHSSCNSWAMLRTKFFGRPENGAGGCAEPFAESSFVSRSVVGAFGEPSGNRNWRCDNDAGICPELIRILHFLFPPPIKFQETGCSHRQLWRHSHYTANDGQPVRLVVLLTVGWVTCGAAVITGGPDR
jgi:hypothetical protein